MKMFNKYIDMDENRTCLNKFYLFLDKVGDVLLNIVSALSVPFARFASRKMDEQK